MASHRWNRILPRSGPDRMAMGFVLTELTIEVVFEIYVVLPSLFEPFSQSYNIHLAIGLFFLFNFLGNMFLSIVTDLTSGSTILPSVLKPDWIYCHLCMHNSPPRSYHCHDCKRCVLKRDHHCLFTGRCVGYNNHRYYMMMLFYLCIGAVYANYLNVDYTMEMLHTLNWKLAIAIIAPVFGWMIGLTQSLSFFVCFQCGTCIISMCLALGLYYYHFLLILRGQTTHEWRRAERCYDRGWKQNFLEVFGTRWYLIWLFPWMPSPLPGDGIHFLKKKHVEDVKDL